MAIVFPGGTQNFPGKVCQVKLARYTSQTTVNAGSNWTVISGFSLNITPQNTSNQILIIASLNGAGLYGNYTMGMRLYNGSSFIGSSPDNGSRPGSFQTGGCQTWNNYHRQTLTGCAIDFGFSNTNQRTYTIYVRDTRDNGSININRAAYDDNSGSSPVGVSYMLAYELEDS